MYNKNTEFELLATAAKFIEKEYAKGNEAWQSSPFEWVLYLPTGSKGSLGKRLIKQWCALKELAVDRSPDSEADMLINGHRVEIKFSTLWKAKIYKFQQIRNQNYEYCILLGISPFEAHCWVVSKNILWQYVIGHMGQHTGSSGQETSWLSVNPAKPPDWLSKCGGTLEEAYVVLKGLSHRK
ncbi:MAG: hypothetical protein MUO77_12765 [Anaerolineales bacterium]|nr:hypothetical protein [Anaerolineales bacterium]